MKNVVVVGSQWGDEGKGKIVDWLSSEADSEIIKFSVVTSIPCFLISSISLRSAQGSITTPFPRIEILSFRTIPEGNNLNLNTFLSITKVCLHYGHLETLLLHQLY